MAGAGILSYLDTEAAPVGVAGRQGRTAGTLVLLHAFPMNAHMWEPQMALAREGWRVIAPHFRGFDGVLAAPRETTMGDVAGDVVDLLDSLHIHDAVVGGLSMGGYAAFALLRHARHYIRGLILADTRSQADAPEATQAREKMIMLTREKGASAIADEMVPRLLGASTRRDNASLAERVRLQICSNPPDAIEGAIRALMTREDATPLLSTVRVPTLIVVGEEDLLTPPALSEEMHRAIAASELVTIPKAGHLSNLEQPEAFNAAVARFLSHRV